MSEQGHGKAAAARRAAIRRFMELMLEREMTIPQLEQAMGVSASCCRKYLKEGVTHEACGIVGTVSSRTNTAIVWRAKSAAAIDAMMLAMEREGSMKIARQPRNDGGKARRLQLLAAALAVGRRIISRDDGDGRLVLPAAHRPAPDDNPVIGGAWLAGRA